MQNIDDLIIGASAADPNDDNFAGESYVVFGRNTAVDGTFDSTLELSGLDGSNGFVIEGFLLEGIGQRGYNGESVSSAGDINGDGSHDISDAVASLDYLFSSGAPGCVASVDVNDDDATNIADTVSLLSYLFAGGAQPPAPFPACGVDPNGSALSCDAFPQCP